MGQCIQFGALLGGQTVAEPLRGRRPFGQRVQQFLDVARVFRKVLAVLGHEVLEILMAVLAAGVLVEEFVEVVEHLVDGLAVFIAGVLQCLFHAREALVEHLPAEQVLDLLVALPRLGAAPVVVGEFLHGLGR